MIEIMGIQISGTYPYQHRGGNVQMGSYPYQHRGGNIQMGATQRSAAWWADNYRREIAFAQGWLNRLREQAVMHNLGKEMEVGKALSRHINDVTALLRKYERKLKEFEARAAEEYRRAQQRQAHDTGGGYTGRGRAR